jgi:hypothetical protein
LHPPRWRPGRHSRRASGRRASVAGSGGPSFGARRARRRLVVWPPPHRRDLQRRSLPRIDPASRREPTRPSDCIGRAAAVCHLHRDVFVKRSAFDRIPVIRHPRRPHCALSQFSVSVDSVMGFLPDGAASQPGGKWPRLIQSGAKARIQAGLGGLRRPRPSLNDSLFHPHAATGHLVTHRQRVSPLRFQRADHRRTIRALDLEPVPRRSRPVGCAQPLRHDALEGRACRRAGPSWRRHRRCDRSGRCRADARSAASLGASFGRGTADP